MSAEQTKIDTIAREFVTYYYQLLAQNRAGLGALYQAHSMLTFEGAQMQGPQAILERLQGLPQFHPGPGRQKLQCFFKIDAVSAHNKIKDISPGMATETVKHITVGGNGKRSRFFLMERA